MRYPGNFTSVKSHSSPASFMTRTISFSRSFYSILLLQWPLLFKYLEAKSWRLYRTSPTNSSCSLLLPIFLLPGSPLLRIFFGWYLNVNCANFSDLENAVCVGLGLISVTWLAGHGTFPYNYHNLLSIYILLCWNKRQDKRHRADVQFGDQGPCQELRTGPRPQAHFT